MSYAAHRKSFGPYLDGTAVPAEPVAGIKPAPPERPRGLLRRILDGLLGPQQRGIERDAARLLAQSGGHLTDSLEREMMRQLSTSGWSRRTWH